MNINTVSFPRFKAEVESYTTIEGRLPFPDGRTGADPLFYSGSVVIAKTTAHDDKICVSGEIVISVICSDEDGSLYSFTSKAPFEHEAEASGVRSGMDVRDASTLMGLNLKGGGDALSVNAQVSFLFTVFESLPLYTADTESTPVAVETHVISLEHTDKEAVLTVKSRIRE